ncbi:protein of unknown function DUF1217 [Rhizobium leguminosarum bv. trifolii WSM2304]|uniref:DUF1217 domain-containing protein n=1 Tax=Rhizobium leguminosarum bv. trifolii (strain WSM2304) TaxID=395492 RepID=A0ABF7QJ69_RHILW|nr:DUF1217 domain-containing protein [Rhizobium leguminosarum]ACI53842.1 protein of unknown function DUF1217 [Rhizobium leguminosarum bv. trifolii WSM2304]
MITASLAYTILSKDMTSSLNKVASQATVKKDAEYYADHINKVTSVDDFLGDYKLYSYAMKAYGLEDMTYAKAFMKKVLESDLTDPNSYANKLSDTRYREFASAFNFNAPEKDVQTDAQEDDLIGLYKQSFIDADKATTAESTYYSNNIDSVTTVDDLVNNTRLRTYVLKTFNIDPTYASKDFLRQVLTSDLSDPTSVVNTQGGDKYKALAAQFSFNADGTVTGTAQTAAQKASVIETYTLNSQSVIIDNSVGSDVVYVNKTAADYNQAYYTAKIGTITNVDDLVADKRLTSYIKTAYSMGADFTAAALRTVLTDPGYAQLMGFTNVYNAFNFKSDGSTSSTARVRTLDQANKLSSAASQTANYYKVTSQSSSITNVDALLADGNMARYIKDAYGLGTGFSNADLKNILTDSAYAAAQGHADLNADFNFQADGSINGSVIQTDTQRKSTTDKSAANAAHFNAMIDSVTSVDDIMSDPVAVSYLRTSMQVADSVSDATLRTFLVDPAAASAQGYSDVHDLFNFKTDGSVATLYASQTAAQSASTSSKADNAAVYYQATIAGIANVDQLLSDQKLNNFVRNAFGIPSTVTDVALRGILTDQSGTGTYADVAAAFNFKADGSLKDGLAAQTDTQIRNTKFAAGARTDDYSARMATIANVDDLIADPAITNFLKSTYNLPLNISNADLKSYLTDATAASAAGYADLNADFNFAADGSLPVVSSVQTADQAQTTNDNYMARYDDEREEAIDEVASNYSSMMADSTSLLDTAEIKSVNDFMRTNATADFKKSNDNLPDPYHVALQAFGLTEQDVPRSMMRKILTSDAYDPNGYIASLKDERITNMARAFNFGPDGKAASPFQALPDATLAKYATDYKAHMTMLLKAGPVKDKASKDATTEVDYFAKGMAKVKSLDDFLDDSRLTDLVLKANNLDPKDYDKATLKKIFTSDPDDKKSYLNAKADARFKDIVAAFNFDKDGNLTRAKMGTIQNKAAEEHTQELYVQQTMEAQQGESNDGVRLALYFSRKAPSITSIYSILGDKALYQVVTTAYSLPSQMSGMDVTKQADLLNRFVKLEDLQDPKKVDKLVRRFTAMYDVQNSTQQSPALQILTGGGTQSS